MIPQALYFPYIDLSANRLSPLLALVQEIILYRLPQEKTEDFLEAASRRGRIRCEEINFFRDPAQAARLLADFTQWSAEFRDPAFLSILHRRRLEEQEKETAAGLAGSIRHYDSGPTARPDVRQEAQLFLSFLRFLERQQGEVESLLSQVDERDGLMASILGADEGDLAPSSGGRLSAVPGDLLTAFLPQRLLAWGRFYDAFGPEKIPLVTDSIEVIDQLDQNLARLRPPRPLESGQRTEVLQLFVEADFGLPAGPFSLNEAEALIIEAAELRQGAWGELLSRVCERPVDEADLEKIRRQAAKAMAARPRPWSGRPGETRLTLTGYFLPGVRFKPALLQALGLALEAGEEPASSYSGPIFLLGA
jgi:hypothetical protein